MSKWKNFKPKPNYFWSIASVAVVLFLIGIFGLITMHSADFLESVKEEFEIIVEINPKATDSQIEKLSKSLAAEKGVLEGSVKYTSKEDGLVNLSEDLGPELLDLDMPNPLTDVISFRMAGETFEMSRLEEIRDKYSKGHEEVLTVYFQEGLIESVVANLDKVGYFVLGAGLILCLLAMMLIYNAIRLSIYANRFLIRNMELVGASWGFIRRPFLKKSIRHGLWSATLALVGLAVAYLITIQRLPELKQYLSADNLLYLVGVIALLGVVINLSSTWIVVTRFLRMRAGDLHL